MKTGLMVLLALFSSAFSFQKEKIESWYANFAMGPGYPNPDGGLWAANMIYGSQWLELRWGQNGEIFGEPDIPAEYVNDIGLLYGKGVKSKRLIILRHNVHWKYFGIGTTIFSNLNMPKSHVAVSFGVIAGRL
jgi:hypothetical protein